MEEYETVDLLPCEYDLVEELTAGHFRVKQAGEYGLVYVSNNSVRWHLPMGYDDIEYIGGNIFKLFKSGSFHFFYAHKTGSFMVSPGAERSGVDGAFFFQQFKVPETNFYFWALYEHDRLQENRFLFKEVEKDEASSCFVCRRFDGSVWHLLIIKNKPRCMRVV